MNEVNIFNSLLLLMYFTMFCLLLTQTIIYYQPPEYLSIEFKTVISGG